MAKFELDNIEVAGVSCAVPINKVETASFYKQFGRESVDNFIKMTGILETRRTKEEQTASDLCFAAAQNLIEKKSVDPETIGALVFISQYPDYVLPATACVLHKRLGLSENCMAFDVNLGCSGYVYGLNIVGSLMATSDIQRALLLFGDTSIKTTSPEDKSSVMLFGEGGSATLLEKAEGTKINGELKTDGNGFKAIIMPSGAFRNRNGDRERTVWGDGNIRSDYDGYMNGTDVFSFSITKVPRLIKSFMESHGKTAEDYNALVLHQANLYIIKQIAKKTKFPMDKVPLTLERFGNTSGTSIPLTLCDTYAGQKGGMLNLLLCGFGIGLSWGVVSLPLRTDDILPIIETDDYYKEGGVPHD